jgi:hypothetical protein
MLKDALVAIGILAVAACQCFANDPIEFSALGKVGYQSPLGKWTSHRYASGIDQFGGGYALSPELEVKVGDVGISIMYAYTSMSTTDWEDYVGRQGEDLYASGSVAQLGGVIEYFFIDGERNAAHIEGGLCYVFLNGDERYRGFSYDYDFMKSGLGFLAGAGYRYSVNRRLSLVLPVRLLWKPKGIKYPEGKTHDIFGLLFMPGLRLTF